MMVGACADAWEMVLGLVKIFSSPPVLVNSLHFCVVLRLHILCTYSYHRQNFSIVRLCTPAPRAGFRGVSGGFLGAAGLVAVVVRDALGRLLMGLVHG